MNKRDLKADLKLCNKVTSGPWLKAEEPEIVVENTFSQPIIFSAVDNLGKPKEEMMKTEDLEFIIQAREGWPYAIERALESEALARELMEALGGLSYYVTTGEIDTPRFYKDFEVYGDLLDKSKEVLGDE